MAVPNTKAVEQVAKSFGAEAANEAKMMANKKAAQDSGIFKEASSFSLVGTLGSVWSKASNLILFAPMLAGVVGWAAKKAPSKVGGALGKASAVMNLANAPIKGRKASEGVPEVKGLHESVSDIFASSPATANKINDGMNRIGKYAQDTAIGKSKIGKKALENLKETPISNVIFNAGFAVQGTASIALSMRDKVRTLKQMQKDLTGKEVSSTTILMGGASLHPLVNAARKETTGGKSLASTGLQLAGVVGNIYLAIFNKSSGFMGIAKAMGVGMGTNMAANMLSSGDTALQSYRDMTLSMAQTGKADVSLYEGLIGGLAQKAPSELVRQIAEKAYVKQMAPAEVLKMMAETDFMKNPKSRSFVAAEAARRNTAGKAATALAGA